jgi:hypothetical protein
MNTNETIEAARDLIRLEDDVRYYMDKIEESKVTSVFEEKFASYTEDVEEWKKLFQSEEIKKLHQEMNQEAIFEEEIIRNAIGFALGPVILYKKKAYEMLSIQAKSLEELKETLKDKTYILYFVLCHTIDYEIESSESFVTKKLEIPKKFYIFRGCFLDENLKDQIIKRNKELLVDILIEK